MRCLLTGSPPSHPHSRACVLRCDHARAPNTACQHTFLTEYYVGESEDERARQREEPHILSEWLTITGVATLPMEQLQNLIFQEMLQFHAETIHLNWGAANPEADLS